MFPKALDMPNNTLSPRPFRNSARETAIAASIVTNALPTKPPIRLQLKISAGYTLATAWNTRTGSET